MSDEQEVKHLRDIINQLNISIAQKDSEIEILKTKIQGLMDYIEGIKMVITKPTVEKLSDTN
jgi:hypothetical protein